MDEAVGGMHEHATDGERLLTLGGAPLLWRGVALGAAALGLAVAAGKLVRVSLMLAPVGVVLAAGAVLAGWAALIHVTGGERFDDGGCD